MKSLAKYLFLPLALMTSRESVDKIERKQGLGSVYNVSLEQGLYQISKIAEGSEGEDSWFFDGNKWHDVGESSSKYSTTFRISKKQIQANNKKHIFIHPHPMKYLVGDFPYFPPSKIDVGNSDNYSKAGLKKGEVKVADARGIWTHYFINEPKDSIAKDSILNQYQSAERALISKTLKKDFNFDKEYLILKNKAKDLGIFLDYKKIK